MKMTAIAVMAALVLLIGGCAALYGTNESQGKLAIQYATHKAINGESQRAEKLLAWIEDARQYVRDDEAVRVSIIDRAVRERIDWNRLEAADQLLIQHLLTQARERLENELSTGVLTKDQRVKLLTVLEWIEAAANGYTV